MDYTGRSLKEFLRTLILKGERKGTEILSSNGIKMHLKKPQKYNDEYSVKMEDSLNDLKQYTSDSFAG